MNEWTYLKGFHEFRNNKVAAQASETEPKI